MRKNRILVIVGIIILGVTVLLGHRFLGAREELIKVEANPQLGFNYNYYLYIPKGAKHSEIKYMLVESNNTGKPSDDYLIHDESAKRLIQNGVSNRIAKELQIPLLVPAFTRPMSSASMYTHALDSDTLKNTEGQLVRIDLQLISMIEDAQNRLEKKGIVVNDKVFMNGFSASGNFSNRFAVLHPQIVKAVVSGGVNGMPIIPSKEWGGKKLPFHIGIANIDEIAGIQFNLEEYKKVAQYIYMGDLDDNDTLPYSDAFNEDERQIVIEVLGQEMKERWKKSKLIYKHLDISAQMVTYKGIGHTITSEVENDIIDFFRLNAFGNFIP